MRAEQKHEECLATQPDNEKTACHGLLMALRELYFKKTFGPPIYSHTRFVQNRLTHRREADGEAWAPIFGGQKMSVEARSQNGMMGLVAYN